MQIEDGGGDTEVNGGPVAGASAPRDGSVIEVSGVPRIEPSVATHRRERRSMGALVVDLRPDDDLLADDHSVPPGDVSDEHRHAPTTATDPAPAPEPLRPLKGRVAVVTGGAGGVGRAIALDLASAGARVCVLGRDVAAMRETAAMAGPDAAIVTLQCDVGSVSEIDGVVDFIGRLDRPVDILIHGEGVHVRGAVEHGSVTDLDEQYLVNLRGPYLLSQRLLEGIRDARGHIVFVNPVTEGAGGGFSQHTVVHHGVSALADALRDEVDDDAVAVTCVHVSIPDPATDAPAPDLAAVSEIVVGTVAVRDRLDVTDVRVRARR